jgi:hypothetical protein
LLYGFRILHLELSKTIIFYFHLVSMLLRLNEGKSEICNLKSEGETL